MGKPLNMDLIVSRAKTDNLYLIKKINLWGNEIDDVKILREMPNVEVVSLSVNLISSLKEFANCHKLQELYLRKNNISDLSEVRYLADLQHLRILWLWDNPCTEHPHYRLYVIKCLPNLVKLDNDPITPEERAAAAKLNISFGDEEPPRVQRAQSRGGYQDYDSGREKVRESPKIERTQSRGGYQDYETNNDYNSKYDNKYSNPPSNKYAHLEAGNYNSNMPGNYGNQNQVMYSQNQGQYSPYTQEVVEQKQYDDNDYGSGDQRYSKPPKSDVFFTLFS